MSEYVDPLHEKEVEQEIKRARTADSRRSQHERIGEAFLSRTRAFGKLILFGEHFVVYKVPALVAAVSAYTDCECAFTDTPGLEVVDDRPAVPGYKVEKKAEGDEAISIVLKHFKLDPAQRGMRLTFGGDLTAVSGIGASAAQVVALSRAIGLALPKELSDDDVRSSKPPLSHLERSRLQTSFALALPGERGGIRG